MLPIIPDDEPMRGSISRGTPNASRIASSHSNVRRSIMSVRDALVTSVMCSPVSFQINQLSIFPARSPSSAFPQIGDVLNSHLSFVPEKYVAIGRRLSGSPDGVPDSWQMDWSGILPHYRIVQGPAGQPVPDHSRLTLVGDPHRSDVS
jgi:hypothetical protein